MKHSDANPTQAKRQLDDATSRCNGRDEGIRLRRSIVDHILEGELWSDNVLDAVSDRSRDDNRKAPI